VLMPRIRSVHPQMLISEDIADLSIPCQMHFVRLWVVADDAGRGKDRPRWLKGAIWPIQDDVDCLQIEAWQAELAAHGRIVRYADDDGELYWEITNFGTYQRPSKPTPSRIPPPSGQSPVSPAELRDGTRPQEEASATPQGDSVTTPDPPRGDREGRVVEGSRSGGEGLGGEPNASSSYPQAVSKPDAPPNPPASSGGEPEPPPKRRTRSPARQARNTARQAWTAEVAPAIARHGRNARWRDLPWTRPETVAAIEAAGGWTQLCNSDLSDAQAAFSAAWPQPAGAPA